MPLIIPQGKQDTTQDNKFNPIIAQDVMLEITDLKLAKTQPNTLEVTLRVLDGQYKNRFIFDRVTFDPNNAMSWKYRALRKCAGVPYKDNEPTSIDIEALLLHKAVKADLSIRKGKNKDGEDTDYQDVKYKVVNVQPTPVPNAQPGSVFPSTPVQAATPTQPVVTKTKTISKPQPTPVEAEEFAQVVQAEPVTPTQDDASNINITDESDWD